MPFDTELFNKAYEEYCKEEKERIAMLQEQIKMGCDKCPQWDDYLGCSKCASTLAI